MEFIDTHTHNYDPAFEGCEEEIIRKGVDAGVGIMLQADIDSHERPSMFALVDRNPGVLRPMLGLYPGSVTDSWRDEIDALAAYRDRGVVAIGEIGLDYHNGTDFRKEQLEAFRVQLELASEWDLPVNIHLRDATEDFFTVIRDCRHLHLRGNLHAFGGSIEMFRRLCSCGGDWYVGIGGVVTFKNSAIGRHIAEFPLERIVLETDAPYLAPTPHRGERNDSSNIPLIAAFIAGSMGTDIERIAQATTYNARQLFSL